MTKARQRRPCRTQDDCGEPWCITREWRADDAEGVGITRKRRTVLQAGPGNGTFEHCNGPVGANQYDLMAYNRISNEMRSLSVTMQDTGD